jgi:ABC-type iron transport system FetAB ATPase subunit
MGAVPTAIQQKSMREPKQPLVQLRGIYKKFGNNVILDGVDIDIYKGEGLGIIGPSGTGKSTVLRIIAGLLAPDEGEVYVQGQKRRGLIEDAEDPIYIGMVFQQAALFDSDCRRKRRFPHDPAGQTAPQKSASFSGRKAFLSWHERGSRSIPRSTLWWDEKARELCSGHYV